MKKTALIAFIMAAISPFANAQAAPQKGGVCIGQVGYSAGIGADTKFDCEHIGAVTIKEIYEKRFRIVSVVQSTKLSNYFSLIIEEQK